MRLYRVSLSTALVFLSLSAVSAQTGARAPVQTVAGMPPVVDAGNLYSEAGAGKLSPATAGALSRVYVPNVKSGDVYVIDPAKFEVVDHFQVGGNPQHIIPSWDLKTLWVNNNGLRGPQGSLTPIDPKTGKPGQSIAVEDPYNLYFTPDGRSCLAGRRSWNPTTKFCAIRTKSGSSRATKP